MKIQTSRNKTKYILALDGRFDASWSSYVDSNIEAAIQGGHHEIDIDLSQVGYMSSAGIGVLLKYRKKLIGVHGCLRVIDPTENVLSVLRLMRLTDLLLGD
ncbi:MAG: STAS domain-containing protein, partial [Planctomycetes bacterium]|nr:STAS domain-containing protein [Planctomycetota bacterium]